MVIEKVSIVEMFVSLGEVCMTVSLQIVKSIWKSRIPPCFFSNVHCTAFIEREEIVQK